MLRCGGSQRVAFAGEAVARQPENGENSRAGYHCGPGPVQPGPWWDLTWLLRNRGSQGHHRKTRSGVAFKAGDFLACPLWLLS